MPEKLKQGDKMPPNTLNLAGGGQLSLPDELPGRYRALLGACYHTDHVTFGPHAGVSVSLFSAFVCRRRDTPAAVTWSRFPIWNRIHRAGVREGAGDIKR